MDDFAKKYLEKAEQRHKELGLPTSLTPQKPLSEVNSSDSSYSSPLNTTYLKSPRTKVTRFDTSKENSDTNVEINITAPSDVQVEVEVSECDVDEFGNLIPRSDASSSTTSSSKAAIRDTSRSHLQRMGALYADKDISSPIHRTETDFCAEPDSYSGARDRKKLTRLQNLATTINNWEDDPSRPNYRTHRKTINPNDKRGATPKKTFAPQPPIPEKSSMFLPKKPVISPRKIVTAGQAATAQPSASNWDPKVMKDLESQGFQRRESSNNLVYNFNKKPTPDVADTTTTTTTTTNTNRHIETREMPKAKPKAPQPPSTSNVRDRAALFEKRKSIFQGRDPMELSIKDRMKIFEKNKGTAPLPMAPFGQNIPASVTKPSGNTLQRQKLPIPEKPKVVTVTETRVFSPKKTIEEVAPETKATGRGVLSTVASLLSKEPTISESKISQDVKRQRQAEMELLLNRHKRSGEERPIPKAPPLPPAGYLESPTLKRRSADSLDGLVTEQSPAESNDPYKRARTTGDRLYPVLSDIESVSPDDQEYTTASVSPSQEGEHSFPRSHAEDVKRHFENDDDENDNDSSMDYEDQDSDAFYNTSLGRSVLQAVKDRSQNFSNSHKDHSFNTSSEVSQNMQSVDAMLDDAFDIADDDESDEESPTPTKSSLASNSFRYDGKPRKSVHYETIPEDSETDTAASYRSPVKSELTVDEKDDQVTLVHTVSFYRKQQKVTSSPVRPTSSAQRSTHADSDSEIDSDMSYEDDEGDSEHLKVQEKIKQLLDEVCKQQTIISQTSQALNLCASTIEFSGSTESVDAERHLLVATHRRQACLDEVQRLRVEQCIRPHGSPEEKGRLTIRDISIPLKQEYIKRLASDLVNGHNLVCLVKYNETVIATKTVPTLPGLNAIRFPEVLTLDNVYTDFKVTMEIYGMTAQRELLPHEVKYHIAIGKKANKQMTPKRKNNRLVMPPVQSPAGPHAVRSPALIQYGFVIFSLRDVKRTTWSLNSVGGVSPLEGQINMNINCQLTVRTHHHGFLTMYEDVSGLGAWHRRWCRLQGSIINYWLYPEDEKKKAPLGSIDLTHCCTQKVQLAPREVCARLNTILLEFKRPRQEGDQDTLTQYVDGRYTIKRRLLSADTKEERERWCCELNKVLSLIKSWGTGV